MSPYLLGRGWAWGGDADLYKQRRCLRASAALCILMATKQPPRHPTDICLNTWAKYLSDVFKERKQLAEPVGWRKRKSERTTSQYVCSVIKGMSSSSNRILFIHDIYVLPKWKRKMSWWNPAYSHFSFFSSCNKIWNLGFKQCIISRWQISILECETASKWENFNLIAVCKCLSHPGHVECLIVVQFTY